MADRTIRTRCRRHLRPTGTPYAISSFPDHHVGFYIYTCTYTRCSLISDASPTARRVRSRWNRYSYRPKTPRLCSCLRHNKSYMYVLHFQENVACLRNLGGLKRHCLCSVFGPSQMTVSSSSPTWVDTTQVQATLRTITCMFASQAFTVTSHASSWEQIVQKINNLCIPDSQPRILAYDHLLLRWTCWLSFTYLVEHMCAAEAHVRHKRPFY